MARQAINETGQNVVHADAVGRVLVGVKLGETGQNGPHSGRHGKGGFRFKHGKGGNVDDRPAALPLHSWRDQASHPYDVQHHQI